jgi:hypothetical protein
MNAEMTQELTMEKVVEAITSLPKSKAPGHDGLSREFFPRKHGKNCPHASPSLSSNVLIGIDLGFHQQRDDHLDPEIGRPLQVRELETHHSPWKYLQNTC